MIGLGSELSGTGYYDDSTAEDHIDAWEPAHAGSGDDVVSDDEYSARFAGGWAGNCRDGEEWMTDEGSDLYFWYCDGEVIDEIPFPCTEENSCTGTRDVVIIPDFETTAYLPATETVNGQREIGVTLFPFLMQPETERRVDDTRDAYYPGISGGEEVEGAVVRCWLGNLDEKPINDDGVFDNNDRAFEGTANMPSGDSLWSISSTVEDDGRYSGYACEWFYEVTGRDELARGESGDVAHVHRDEGLRNRIEESYSLSEDGFP